MLPRQGIDSFATSSNTEVGESGSETLPINALTQKHFACFFSTDRSKKQEFTNCCHFSGIFSAFRDITGSTSLIKVLPRRMILIRFHS